MPCAERTSRRSWTRPRPSGPPRSRTAGHSAGTSPMPRPPATCCRSCSRAMPRSSSAVRARSEPIAANAFFTGYRKTALAEDELILRIRIPAAARPRTPVPQGRDAPRAGDFEGRDERGLAGARAHERLVGCPRGIRVPWPPRPSGPRHARRHSRASARRPRLRIEPRRRWPRSSSRSTTFGRPQSTGGRSRHGSCTGSFATPAGGDHRLRLGNLNAADRAAFVTTIAPLFEGAPRFLDRLASARPFADVDSMFAEARAIAHAMPDTEQVELIDAHPRLGAPPATRLGALVPRTGLRPGRCGRGRGTRC